MRRATNAIGALAGSFLFGIAMMAVGLAFAVTAPLWAVMAACSNADNLRTSGQPDNTPRTPNP